MIVCQRTLYLRFSTLVILSGFIPNVKIKQYTLHEYYPWKTGRSEKEQLNIV